MKVRNPELVKKFPDGRSSRFANFVVLVGIFHGDLGIVGLSVFFGRKKKRKK